MVSRLLEMLSMPMTQSQSEVGVVIVWSVFKECGECVRCLVVSTGIKSCPAKGLQCCL